MVIQNNTKFISLLLFIVGVVAGSVFATAETGQVVELAPFEVRETAPAEIAIDHMGIEHIDALDSTSRNAGTLGEALSWEVGLSSSTYGAGASRPMIRGLGGYRVGVYDGGMATGDLSASSPDHAVAIEPLFIRSITIHRGVAALRHGGGAIGGAIDTEPDYLPVQETPIGFSSEVGGIFETANQGRTGYLKSGFREGALAFRVNLLTRNTEDYSIPGYARTAEYDINNRIRLPPSVQGNVAPNPVGKVPNTWTRTRVAAIGAAWLQDTAHVGTTYLHYASQYGVPMDGHTHGNPYGVSGVTGPSPHDTVSIEITQDRLFSEGEWATDTDLLEGLKIRGALSRYKQREYEGRFLSNDFAADTGSIAIEALSEATFGRILLGSTFGVDDFENSNTSYNAGRPDTDYLNTQSFQYSAYAISRIPIQTTEFVLGARYDFQYARRMDRKGLSRTDVVPTLVAEVVQPLWREVKGSLSIGYTGRVPNADELYIEAPHGATGIYQIPNPDLFNETAKSAEIRLEGDHGRVAWQIGAFVRHFDNFIYLENQGYEVDGLTAYTFVQREAAFIGGEAKVDFTLHEDTAFALTLSFFGDYVRATDKTNDKPLPRIPPLRLGTGLQYDWHKWMLSARVLHAFDQNRVPQEVFGTLAYQTPSDAYTLVTLMLSRSVEIGKMELKGTLQITNLLDEEVRQHTSFLKDVAPLQGRSLQVSVSVEW